MSAPKRPECLSRSPGLLINGYRNYLQGVKRSEREVDLPPSFRADVEQTEPYRHSSYVTSRCGNEQIYFFCPYFVPDLPYTRKFQTQAAGLNIQQARQPMNNVSTLFLRSRVQISGGTQTLLTEASHDFGQSHQADDTTAFFHILRTSQLSIM